MPLIAPQIRQDRQTVSLKLEVRLLTLLKLYAECISSSPDYVLNQALLVAFSSDREFQDWLLATHPEDAGHLRALVDEQPRAEPVGRLRGRPPAWSKSSAERPGSQPATAQEAE